MSIGRSIVRAIEELPKDEILALGQMRSRKPPLR